jgi:hypothetical protein
MQRSTLKKFINLRFDGPNTGQVCVFKINTEIKMKRVLFKVAKQFNLKIQDWKFLIERTSKLANPVLSLASQDIQNGDSITIIQHASSG